MGLFNAIYQGALTDLNNDFHTGPDRPLLGIDVKNEALYVNTGQSGWVQAGSTGSSGSGSGTAAFDTLPINLTATTGQTEYELPQASVNPAGSFMLQNGIKSVFGRDYTIQGDVLTILSTNPAPPVTGDSLQLYFS